MTTGKDIIRTPVATCHATSTQRQGIRIKKMNRRTGSSQKEVYTKLFRCAQSFREEHAVYGRAGRTGAVSAEATRDSGDDRD